MKGKSFVIKFLFLSGWASSVGMFLFLRLSKDLLGWVSEADVHAFALANDYLFEEDEETIDDESEVDDD